jgi:hypothetical protein
MPRKAIIILRSSTNVDILIKASSRDVSLRSAPVEGSLAKVPPPVKG